MAIDGKLKFKPALIHGAPLDYLFSSLTNWRKFFVKGIGDWEYIESIPHRAQNIPTTKAISIEWQDLVKMEDGFYRDGIFLSPIHELLPIESKTVHIRLISPTEKLSPDTPLVIHFAGTGDEGPQRRQRLFARPLLQKGVASLLIENPFYGKRAPAAQPSCYLQHLSDLIKLGHGASEEGRSLVAWAKGLGQKNIVLTGMSMGGQLAAFAGAFCQGDVAIIPCVPPHSPSGPYLEKLLSQAVDWQAVESDLKTRGLTKDFLPELFNWMDIRRFKIPTKPHLCHIVAAKYDAYIPQESAMVFEQHWPGSRVTWLEAGHISTVILHTRTILDIILEMIEIQEQEQAWDTHKDKLAL